MITSYHHNGESGPAPAAPNVVVSLRRGGFNRLSFLAMMVPLLLLAGMGLAGLTRRLSPEPSFPGALTKAQIETGVRNLAEKFTSTKPDILSANLQVAYAVQRRKQFPEWSVLCRAGQDYYLFRVNGRNGKIFGVNRVDDISDLKQQAADFGPAIEAGITPPSPGRVSEERPAERDGDGKQAARSAARRYLSAFGLSARDVNPVSDEAEHAYKTEKEESRVWTFLYFLKTAAPQRKAIRISVDSATGRLESFWNPASSL